MALLRRFGPLRRSATAIPGPRILSPTAAFKLEAEAASPTAPKSLTSLAFPSSSEAKPSVWIYTGDRKIAFLGRDVGLGGLGFKRWYATKKAASAAKGKGKPKKGAQTETKGKKGKAPAKTSGGESGSAGLSAAESENLIRQPEEFVEDHLFTGSRGIAEITANDINKYYFVSEEDARKYFAEGFPKGLIKEFQASRSSFIQVRGIALEMCNWLNYSATNTFAYNSRELLPYIKLKRPKPARADAAKATGALESAVDASTATGSFSAAAIQSLQDSAAEESSVNEVPSPSPAESAVVKVPERIHRVLKEKKHLILDGPVGCGKTFTLAMIVQWARAQGWLVFYVPSAKDWTRGGFYYLNEYTGFWDTPLQAQNALKRFLDSHGEMLGQIKCRIFEPIFLGEAAGLGRQQGPQEITLPEGSSLKDLVEKGASLQTAASNIVVRLRQELDLVTEFPVLIAVDEYNSWFTFSEYFQFLDFRKRRQIHAKELAMVNAFRKMHRTPPHFVAAFSQSTAVGKLPLELPDAPQKTRIMVSRFNKEETKAAISYYHRQKVLHNEPQEQAISRLFYLTNGNGIELRKLARYI